MVYEDRHAFWPKKGYAARVMDACLISFVIIAWEEGLESPVDRRRGVCSFPNSPNPAPKMYIYHTSVRFKRETLRTSTSPAPCLPIPVEVKLTASTIIKVFPIPYSRYYLSHSFLAYVNLINSYVFQYRARSSKQLKQQSRYSLSLVPGPTSHILHVLQDTFMSGS